MNMRQQPAITKAQAELRDAAHSLVAYLDLIASGAIAGPVDPDARCVRATEDAIRLVRMQGPAADAAGEPTDEAQRIAGIAFALMD